MAGRMAGLADSRVPGVTVLATLIQRAVERLPSCWTRGPPRGLAT